MGPRTSGNPSPGSWLEVQGWAGSETRAWGPASGVNKASRGYGAFQVGKPLLFYYILIFVITILFSSPDQGRNGLTSQIWLCLDNGTDPEGGEDKGSVLGVVAFIPSYH